MLHEDDVVVAKANASLVHQQALELIQADPTAAEMVEEMDITELDGFLGLKPPAPGKTRPVVVSVDKEYALTKTNLEKPILAIRFTDDNGIYLSDIVIDGWHRVYRARVEGRNELPTYMLSAKAEKAVRISER